MNKIKTFRKKAKISQKKLSEYLGVSQISVSLYERGLREPNLATIKKLAEALNCKPADLYPVLEG
ncbi:helix-turn-helix domain-containing protein [Mannheimia haemolytica]